MDNNEYLRYGCNEIIDIANKKNQEIQKRFEGLKDYDIVDNITKGKEEFDEISKIMSSALRFVRLYSFICSYPEYISLFLVENAKYNYNNQEGGFWHGVENIIKQFNVNDRPTIVSIFENTLNKYGLSVFSNVKEEGYKLIAPIICHAGIPLNNLDSFFDAINSIYGINYSQIENEIDFACRYADRPVKRYIAFLSEKGILEEQVLKFFDIVNCIKINKNLDAIADLSEDVKEVAIKWVENKKNPPPYQTHYAFPELFLDTELLDIRLKMPQLALNDSSYVIWEISEGESLYKNKKYGKEINGKYHYPEFYFPIKNANRISVALTNDRGEELQNYSIRDINDVSLFDNNGQFNKSRFISKKGAYFLCNEEFKVVNAELRSNECCGLNLFSTIQDNEGDVLFRKDETEKIYTIKEKPTLGYGKKVFEGRANFSYVDAYIETPSILLPNDKQWDITIKNEQHEEIINIEDTLEFDLKSLIKTKFPDCQFGLYKIRLHNEIQGFSSLSFAYIPFCEVKMTSLYPQDNAYQDAKIVFNYCQEIKIVNKFNELVKDVSINREENEFCGTILFDNLNIPFNIVLKAFTWTIWGDDEVYGETNKMSYVSVKDIKKNNMTILNVANNTTQNYKVIVDCGNEKCKVLSLYSRRTLTINLNEYIEYFLSNEDMESEIRIIVADKSFLPICRIKQELYITSFNFLPNSLDKTVSFSWGEDGQKVGRKFVLYNLQKPYLKQEFSIEDKKCEIVLTRDLFQEDTVAEIKKEQKINSIYFATIIKEQLFNSDNLKCLTRKNYIPKDDLSYLDDISFEDVVYAYLFHSIPKINKRIKIKDLYIAEREKIIEYRNRFGDEELYAILNKYELNDKQLDTIKRDLSLYIPIFKGKALDLEIVEKLKNKNILGYYFYLRSINDRKMVEQFQLDVLKDKDQQSWDLAKDTIIFPNWYQKKDFDKSVREYMRLAYLPAKEAIVKTLVHDVLFETMNKRIMICENPEYSKALEFLIKNYRKTFLIFLIK